MEVIAALFDYGEWEGEGFFGVFTSEEKLLEAAQREFPSEYSDPVTFEIRGNELVALFHARTVAENNLSDNIAQRWNLYRVELDKEWI